VLGAVIVTYGKMLKISSSSADENPVRTIDDRADGEVSRPTLIEQRAADRLHAEAVWDLRLLDDIAADSDPCRVHDRDEDVRGEDGIVVPVGWTSVSAATAGVLPG
jgi:hypothetical protein